MIKKEPRKDIMLQEYHKGGLCIHKMLLCQEGYCSECHIHKAAMHLKQSACAPVKKSPEESGTRVLVSASK